MHGFAYPSSTSTNNTRLRTGASEAQMMSPMSSGPRSLSTMAAPLIKPGSVYSSRPMVNGPPSASLSTPSRVYSASKSSSSSKSEVNDNATVSTRYTGSTSTNSNNTNNSANSYNTSITQVNGVDFDNQHMSFSVNMGNLMSNWLDINLLPAAMRNAVHYLSLTNFPRACRVKLESHERLLPVNSPLSKPYTLVLDLDETLIHCSPNRPLNGAPDCIVHFDPNRRGSVGYVSFRPFAKLLLEVASRDFNIVIFTASTRLYADQVINQLDPKGEFISLCLYRQHCTEVDGGYTKDLRILERSLDTVLLVDNSPVSVALQPDHSILCSSYFGNSPHDKELVDLMLLLRDLLESKARVQDICVPRYGLRQWINSYRRSPL